MPNDRQPLDTDQLILLRFDGLAIFTLALGLFAVSDQSWWLFAATLLLPDLSALGYLKGPRLGAWTYNLGHSYGLPATLLVLGHLATLPLAFALGAVWLAHIGIDRAVGYGFKSRAGFTPTHLSF